MKITFDYLEERVYVLIPNSVPINEILKEIDYLQSIKKEEGL